jgi:hypothetical protein
MYLKNSINPTVWLENTVFGASRKKQTEHRVHIFSTLWSLTWIKWYLKVQFLSFIEQNMLHVSYEAWLMLFRVIITTRSLLQVKSNAQFTIFISLWTILKNSILYILSCINCTNQTIWHSQICTEILILDSWNLFSLILCTFRSVQNITF